MMYRFSCRFITYMMIVILAVLTFFSFISTVQVDLYDRVYYTGDTALLHVIFILLLLGAACFIRSGTGFRIKDRHLLAALVFVTLIMGIYTGVADLPPRFDQRAVRSVAANLIVGITDDFLPGGYAEIYPYNHGIILFYELILRIVGYENYIVIQYINLIFMVITQLALYLVMRELTGYYREISLGFILFMPFWGYATFLYGNIPGFCMGMCGLYFCIRYLKEQRIYEALAAGVFMALSFRFKENFAILIIAVAIMSVCELIRTRKVRDLLLPLVIILCVAVSGLGINGILKAKADYHPGKGIPGLPYIAMGLHENEERGAGWHDNYPENLYEETGHDGDLTSEHAKEDIAASLENFRQHPVYMAGFFIRKTASMWNVPDYYSWTLQEGRDEELDQSFLLPLAGYVQGVMNVLQSFLYFFALVYFILHRKDTDFMKLFFALFFIGGFLCHTLWEAHCQYALFYAMGLAAYSTEGLIDAVRLAEHLDRRKRITAAAVMICTGALLTAPAVSDFMTLSRDDARWTTGTGLMDHRDGVHGPKATDTDHGPEAWPKSTDEERKP